MNEHVKMLLFIYIAIMSQLIIHFLNHVLQKQNNKKDRLVTNYKYLKYEQTRDSGRGLGRARLQVGLSGPAHIFQFSIKT